MDARKESVRFLQECGQPYLSSGPHLYLCGYHKLDSGNYQKKKKSLQAGSGGDECGLGPGKVRGRSGGYV